jgi:hypothetical protein
MKKILACSLLLFALACSKSDNAPSESTTTKECGVERWHVKNLLDADAAAIDWNPVVSSIAEQDAFDSLHVGEFAARLDFEKLVVSIPCTIVAYKREDDSDIHIIMQDAALDSMIGEIPSTSCAEIGASRHAAEFSAVQSWVFAHLGRPSTSFKTASFPATVTGVLFQDFAHGQKGHARNYRELHPVTKIE